MRSDKPLPYDTSAFASTEDYVDSLLDFVSTNHLLRTLCGGVHVLDFFTTTNPDLYSRVLPKEWRDFFAGRDDFMDVLDLLMREDLDQFTADAEDGDVEEAKWRDGPIPHASLIEYIRDVRKHLLDRKPKPSQCSRNRTQKKLARHVSVGMTVKKVHEVGLFASYIDELASYISAPNPSDEGNHISGISHLVDFGSGQNYLGRALASEPYNQRIVAIERKSHNAERAKQFDVMARITAKNKVMRNKKAYRAGLHHECEVSIPQELLPPPSEPLDSLVAGGKTKCSDLKTTVIANGDIKIFSKVTGGVQYISHRIQSGNLKDVLQRIPASTEDQDKNMLVISLHSCGNLVHHGLRSLTLNPSVRAVALVGCCYNLLTERLGPATYKLPSLRPANARLEQTGEARDPDGFPMSERMCNYRYAGQDKERGVRLNITARMMAVQAPQNWSERNSEKFFTRHFYRALLQRVFLDRGVVGPPTEEHVGGSSGSPLGHTSSAGTPIIIGSLRKGFYESFVSYVRGALAKLFEDVELGTVMREKMGGITDGEIEEYEKRFMERKKELSVIWSLMAFSAGVVEAAVVVDRWLWLEEQDEVREAWVEPVFEYALSPRNLVVVGIKR